MILPPAGQVFEKSISEEDFYPVSPASDKVQHNSKWRKKEWENGEQSWKSNSEESNHCYLLTKWSPHSAAENMEGLYTHIQVYQN